MCNIHHAVAALPQDVYVRAGSALLQGELLVPENPAGIVLFLHGAGSSRHSPRDRAIAAELHKNHFATFLLGLLTLPEETRDLETGEYRRSVRMLARRIISVTEALGRDPAVRGLPVSFVATGTGAAAALLAAAEKPALAGAIVCRGGRPDLAGAALGRVAAPTLLVVGSEDHDTLRCNHESLGQMRCEKQLRLISGAGHLFEEKGAVEELEALIVDWLQRHLHADASCPC